MHKWKITALAVALLCFSAMTVTGQVEEAQAATTDAQKATSKKNKKAVSSTENKAGKAGAVSAKKGDKTKTVAKADKSGKGKTAKTTKTKSATKTKKSKNKSVSDRDVWMQRAQNSSELLGKASWYGSDFHGGPTASGVDYDMESYTAAHRTLPLGTVVEVTEEDSGKSVLVCINDRGPFKAGRVIDLSQAAASDLGIKQRGIAPVNLKVITDAEGQTLNTDEAFYVTLVRKQTDEVEKVGPFNQYADASVMKEVLRNKYPEASIVLGPVASK